MEPRWGSIPLLENSTNMESRVGFQVMVRWGKKKIHCVPYQILNT